MISNACSQPLSRFKFAVERVALNRLEIAVTNPNAFIQERDGIVEAAGIQSIEKCKYYGGRWSVR